MNELDPKIVELEARLDSLVRTQIDFQSEITIIRRELSKLRAASNPARVAGADLPPSWPTSDRSPISTADSSNPPPPPPAEPSFKKGEAQPITGPQTSILRRPTTSETHADRPTISSPAYKEGLFSKYFSDYSVSARGDLEKFIGENLISKIGIIILVLGVGIGAKYAIDNGWISPMMRIVFGYVMGFGLIGFAIRLKSRYLNFSAVLLSGGMAILYFVTYFGYASYALISQPVAFGLMAFFTVCAVASAILYDRQVIAHIGLVGAYAVPFLLSNNSGNYLFLFSYMTIINGGILAISIKRFWKPLFYTSSFFTWLIFAAWFGTKYSPEQLYLALVFLAVFFAGFYATKIIHGLTQPEEEDQENLICTIITALVFYGFCFAIIDIGATIQGFIVFFSYLAIVTLGILLTSYRFYGRVLVFLCYPLTWAIFGSWFFDKYRPEEHFLIACIFAGVFFTVFYVATLIYRLLTDELGLVENAVLVMSNSFVFYGFGYAILDSRESLQPYEGLFTASHAAFHSLVAQAVSRFKASAIDVVQVLAVLIVTFATVAIPVQFDGNRVTLIWAVEATALFWFGRTRPIPLFEYFSYPIMALATISLFQDWVTAYGERTIDPSEFNRVPFANGDFVTAAVFVAVFAFIYLINRDKRYEPAIDTNFARLLGYIVSFIGLLALYNMFRTEIGNYFHLRIVSDQLAMTLGPRDGSARSRYADLSSFNVLWQLNYTMLFLSVLNWINLRKIRSSALAAAGIVLSIKCLAIFVTVGMALFHELNVVHLERGDSFATESSYVLIRYFSYAFTALLIYFLYEYSRDEMLTRLMSEEKLQLAFEAILYLTIFITASCELVNIMAQLRIPDSLKLGLSILWSVYALALISIGIAMNKKHLRISAFALLGVTIAKLFLYDIADLPTIPKTILFVSIGILMLISSFLYNKYMGRILSGAVEAGK